MTKSRIALGMGITLLLTFTAHARITPGVTDDWSQSVFLGYGLTQINHHQTIRLANTPAPGLSNAYDSDSYAASAVLLGLGVDKVVKTLANNAQFSLGTEIDYLRNDALKGTVHPMVNVNPNFDTLRFSYDNQSLLLFATAKISKENLSKGWGAYVNAGLGGSLNRLSNYHEIIPQCSTAAPMLTPFMDKNKTTVAFAVGAGFKRPINQNAEFAIGYRYINTGKASLGISAVQQTTQTLTSGNLGHHFLLLSLTTG